MRPAPGPRAGARTTTRRSSRPIIRRTSSSTPRRGRSSSSSPSSTRRRRAATSSRSRARGSSTGSRSTASCRTSSCRTAIRAATGAAARATRSATSSTSVRSCAARVGMALVVEGHRRQPVLHHPLAAAASRREVHRLRPRGQRHGGRRPDPAGGRDSADPGVGREGMAVKLLELRSRTQNTRPVLCS